jgi:predicted transcriptional regulator
MDRWEAERRKRFSATRIAKNDEWVRKELMEMDLRAIREVVGKTQVSLAVDMKTTQAELSRAERRSDHRVSTLRKYIEGLGGELEVIARFGEKRVRLRDV